MVVDHHRGAVETPVAAERGVQVRSEDGGLERHLQAVRPADGFVHVGVGIHTDHRSENLPRRHQGVARWIEQHRRLVATVRNLFPTADQSRPGVDGFADPLVDPVDLAVVDQGSDLGVRFARIADLHGVAKRAQPPGHFVGDFGVGENTLDGNANLPGMIEAALGEPRQGVVEIGVGGDDHRRGAAVLERTARARRQFRTQRPPDLRTADEAEEGDPSIGHQGGAKVAGFGHHGAAPVLGQPRLVEDVDEGEARHRRRARRLYDDRAAGRHRRSHLVDDEVEGMVEGADRDHDAYRLVLREGGAPGGRGVDVHRDNAAGFGPEHLDADLDAVHRPVQFDARVGQRFAAFPRRLQRQLIAPFADQPRRVPEDLDAPGCRYPAIPVAVKGMRRSERRFHLRTARNRNLAEQGAVVRGGNVNGLHDRCPLPRGVPIAFASPPWRHDGERKAVMQPPRAKPGVAQADAVRRGAPPRPADLCIQ